MKKGTPPVFSPMPVVLTQAAALTPLQTYKGQVSSFWKKGRCVLTTLVERVPVGWVENQKDHSQGRLTPFEAQRMYAA